MTRQLRNRIAHLWRDLSGQTRRDIASLNEAGVVVGRNGREGYGVLPGGGHVLLEGRCRSGKTAGVLAPTLLAWPDSAFVVTVNSELVDSTSDWRAKVGDVFVVDPYRRPRSMHRYNPLDDIRLRFEATDCAAIARALIGGDVAFPAQQLFVGVVLYLRSEREWELDGTEIVTLGEVRRQIERQDERLMERLRNWWEWGTAALAPTALMLSEIDGDRLLGSRDHLLTVLAPWADPLIDWATSASDFSLLDGDARQTVYLNVNTYSPSRTEALARMMLANLARRESRSRCLAVVDDVILIGHVGYADWLRECPRADVRVVTAAQSMQQLDQQFGDGEGVPDAHGWLVTLSNGADDRVKVTRFADRTRSSFTPIRYFSEPLFAARSAGESGAATAATLRLERLLDR